MPVFRLIAAYAALVLLGGGLTLISIRALHTASDDVEELSSRHMRASVEVMRGCVKGCRFCQAGYVYRPLRERNPEEVIFDGVLTLTARNASQVLPAHSLQFPCASTPV